MGRIFAGMLSCVILGFVLGAYASTPIPQPDMYQKNMASAPVWSPDGERFALVSNANGDASQDIFILDVDPAKWVTEGQVIQLIDVKEDPSR